MEIRKRLSRLLRWEYFWLCLIVIVTVALHLATINEPAELILDEQHYVPAARSIIQTHTDPRPEHPTLAKLIIAAGIIVFGDNPYGWRVPSVLFGTVSIVFFYLICRRLRMSRTAANLATFILGFENMTFIQASVAMLDVFFYTFMLASFWLYLRKNYSLSAISLALSALAKLTGALGAGAIGIHWLVTNRDAVKETGRNAWRKLKFWDRGEKSLAGETVSRSGWWVVGDFVASFLLAPFSFMIFMPICDYLAMGQGFTNPLWRVKEMMSLMSTLTFANTKHDSLSRPWEWLYSPKAMPYWYTPSYMGGISYTVWALIIPVVVYLTYRMWKRNSAATFAFWWFIFTYTIWIPASVITDRISFVFYFYPVIPAICIGLGLAFSRGLNIAAKKQNFLKWLIPALIAVFMIGHLAVLGIIGPWFT